MNRSRRLHLPRMFQFPYVLAGASSVDITSCKVRGENFVAVSPRRCSQQFPAVLMRPNFCPKEAAMGEVNHHVR
jgi:hypothetical protein